MHSYPWSFTSIPEDFHRETYIQIANILNKGESIQLFGAPGSGTSVILQVINQIPTIKNQYFPPSANFTFITIDGNTLLERNALTLARIFLSSLSHTIDISSDLLVINKNIEELVNKTCIKGNLVVILDQFQELDHPELKPFFIALSGLQKKYNPRLQFIFGTNKIYSENTDVINFAQLGRLVIQNIIVTPHLNRNISYWLLKEEEKQLEINLAPHQKEKIFEITAGFPRAIKRLTESVRRGFELEQIEENPAIDNVIAFFLEELIPYRNYLKSKIPLLETYINNKNIDKSIDRIGDVQLKSRLTKNEEKIMKLLLLKKGEVVSRENGINAIWGDKGLDISEHAYDQIIHRLRNKLHTASQKLDIETIKGRGHVLEIVKI